MLILGIDDVYAQTETPTDTPLPSPTPTYEKLFKTSTPKPTLNLNCPGLQPVGWGTVTPDPYWLSNCYSCITQTPLSPWLFETSTPWPSPTINQTMVTYTPFPSPTATIGPHYYVGSEVYDLYVDVLANCNDGQWNCDNHIDIDSDRNIYGALYWIDELNQGPFHLAFGGEDSTAYVHLIEGSANLITITYGCIADYNSLGGPTELCNLVAPSFPVFQAKPGVKNGTDVSISANFGGGVNPYNPPKSAHVHFKFQLIYYGLGPTLTPTSTPDYHSDYCNVVDDIDSGSGGGNPFIGILPEPEIGPGQCIEINDFTIGLDWVASVGEMVGVELPGQLSFPGLKICVRPLIIGNLTILDIVINLDWFITIMGGVLIIRLILRS